MLQLDEIRNLLDPYDATPTECDGMTKICSTILTQQGIEHQPMIGEITYLSQQIPIHLWIQLGDEFIIDYRAKIWLGNCSDIPHGVFKIRDYPHVQYAGEAITIEPLHPTLFNILCLPI